MGRFSLDEEWFQRKNGGDDKRIKPMNDDDFNACFVFCNKSESRWSWLTFSKKFKHVFVLISNGEHWVMMTAVPHGLQPTILSFVKNDYEYLERVFNLDGVISIIGVGVKSLKKVKDRQPFIKLGLTCSESSRIATSLDISTCWTPKSLYKKLLKFDGARNFNIFYKHDKKPFTKSSRWVQDFLNKFNGECNDGVI